MNAATETQAAPTTFADCRALVAALPHRTMRDLRKNTDARGHTHFALCHDSSRVWAQRVAYEVVGADIAARTVSVRNNRTGGVRTRNVLCMTTTHNGPQIVVCS